MDLLSVVEEAYRRNWIAEQEGKGNLIPTLLLRFSDQSINMHNISIDPQVIPFLVDHPPKR